LAPVVEIWTHGLGGPELLESGPAAELSCEPIAAVGAPLGQQDLEPGNPWLEAG